MARQRNAKIVSSKGFDPTDLKSVATFLNEHNKWRRGIGKYKWHENPSKNVDAPGTPAELTEALDIAVKVLRSIGGSTCDCRKCSFKGMPPCDDKKFRNLLVCIVP